MSAAPETPLDGAKEAEAMATWATALAERRVRLAGDEAMLHALDTREAVTLGDVQRAARLRARCAAERRAIDAEAARLLDAARAAGARGTWTVPAWDAKE